MKKALILIILIFIVNYLQAQTNRFPDVGNVGIGTLNPTDKLQVISTNQTGSIRIGGSNEVGNGRLYIQADLLNNNSYIDVYGNNAYQKLSIDGFPLILNNSSMGNVGIGTSSPREKLSVHGNIRAHEIKVENSNWPDYVFKKAYQLPTLEETEQHIKENGHLPGIPSAEDVKINGINLGEMNAKLLQKIEELTLYMIDIKKDNESLRKELDKVNIKLGINQKKN